MQTPPLIPALPRAATKPPDVCRVLVSSDWHGDKATAGFPRFDDVTGSAKRAAALAVDLGCDWFGFLGDLTDPEAGAHRCVQFAIGLADWLRTRGVGSFWLGGNHDACEDAMASTALDPLAAHAKTLTEPGRPAVYVFTDPAHRRLAPGVWVVALPHPHRGQPYDPEAYVRSVAKEELNDELNGERTQVVLVAGHLEVDAYEPGSETTAMPRGRPGRFPVKACKEAWGSHAVLVNGHYHRSHGAKDPVLVPGSIERLDRSEASHLPRVMVLDLPCGSVR